ncbi:MAG: hypothetical protein ACYSSN_05250 [Planctomycetota bacterium]|jgi:hypothetical protein
MVEKNTNVPKSIEEFTTTLAREIFRNINPYGWLVSQGENVAITLNKVKTAALCYDRVWCPMAEREHEQVPEPIRSWRISPLNIAIMSGSKKKTCDLLKMTLRPLARNMSEQFKPGSKVSFVTVYDSEAKRDCEYLQGDREAVVATLSGLAIVDEDILSWEKVLEFRADEKNRLKYKRFLHWLDKEMVGKSQAFIEDEISIRLEDYENALKKHGIKTVIGEVSEVLAGGGLISALSEPKVGLLSVGALTIGKLAVKVGKILLDYEDMEKGRNSEISWVYEVKKISK